MYILLPAMSTANAAPTMRWGRLIHGHSADTMATDTAVCAEGVGVAVRADRVAVGVQAGYHRQRAGLACQPLEDLGEELAEEDREDQGARDLQPV